MKANEEKIKRLLQTAYHEKASLSVGDGWRMDVMRGVRNLGPLNPAHDGWGFADRFVWRFAAVACTVLVGLSLYTLQANGGPEQMLANQFLTDPVSFSLFESFGIL